MPPRKRGTRSKSVSRANTSIEPAQNEDTRSSSPPAISDKEKDKSQVRDKRNKQPRKKAKQSAWTSKRAVFLIGALIGLLIAGYGIDQSGVADGFGDLSRDWLLSHKDLLPKAMMQEVEDITSPNAALSDSFAVGLNLHNEGYAQKHPVVLVPGVISTSLESWGLNGTSDCPSKPHYRKRLWGSWYMIKTMLTDKKCWLQHIMLDKETGLDPPNIRVRAAQGIEAADFFMTGYWLWSKIIENLSALGYDTNTLSVAAYDWRLGYPDLERRDGYFSLLKLRIEQNFRLTGEKTVLAGHSMGSQVIFYFLKWVEADGEGFGNGGKKWVNTYVHSLVDISGSMLGTPKALVALLSGEMKDTVQLNSMAVYGLEQFFARHERAELLMSFPSLASMLPRGGDVIWGNLNGAPDDPGNETEPSWGTFGNFLRFSESLSPYSAQNHSAASAIDYLLDAAPEWYSDRVRNMYSFGHAKTKKEVAANENDPRTWSNPLEAALPNAPDLHIYCFYGVGKDTERAYTYKDTTTDATTPLNAVMDYDNKQSVILGEGDGTVSLVSHAMCHKWQEAGSKYNPGGSKVTIVEMLHQPDNFDLRGGSKTAEHVDILGRTELNELILRVAAGAGGEIEQKVFSNLTTYLDKMDLGPN